MSLTEYAIRSASRLECKSCDHVLQTTAIKRVEHSRSHPLALLPSFDVLVIVYLADSLKMKHRILPIISQAILRLI